MLNNLYNKNIFFCLIFFFLTEQTFAKNEYYKCPEKINTVLSGENQVIKKNTIIGVNYVKETEIESHYGESLVSIEVPSNSIKSFF